MTLAQGQAGTQFRQYRADSDHRRALRGIFGFLCLFAFYLMVVQILGSIFQWGSLPHALIQFTPYCLALAVVVYRGQKLSRWDAQTFLITACLVAVFVVLFLDVTKRLIWFDSIPILGRNSRVRNDLASLAIMVAIASFPAASYLMMEELLLAKRQLDEQVEKLEEALRHVRQLQGLLPICMYCHRIRNDEQTWQRIELYITEHSDAKFTHGLCPECAAKHFPGLNLESGGNPRQSPPAPLGDHG